MVKKSLTSICLSLLLLGTVFFQTGCSRQSDEQYLKSIRQNMFSGKVTAVFLRTTDNQILVKNIPANNPYQVADINVYKNWHLVSQTDATLDTTQSRLLITNSTVGDLVFSVQCDQNRQLYTFKVLERALRNNRLNIGKNKIIERIVLANALSLGEKIYIPSSVPLSRTANVYSQYIYLPGEQIPHISY